MQHEEAQEGGMKCSKCDAQQRFTSQVKFYLSPEEYGCGHDHDLRFVIPRVQLPIARPLAELVLSGPLVLGKMQTLILPGSLEQIRHELAVRNHPSTACNARLACVASRQLQFRQSISPEPCRISKRRDWFLTHASSSPALTGQEEWEDRPTEKSTSESSTDSNEPQRRASLLERCRSRLWYLDLPTIPFNGSASPENFSVCKIEKLHKILLHDTLNKEVLYSPSYPLLFEGYERLLAWMHLHKRKCRDKKISQCRDENYPLPEVGMVQILEGLYRPSRQEANFCQEHDFACGLCPGGHFSSSDRWWILQPSPHTSYDLLWHSYGWTSG